MEDKITPISCFNRSSQSALSGPEKNLCPMWIGAVTSAGLLRRHPSRIGHGLFDAKESGSGLTSGFRMKEATMY